MYQIGAELGEYVCARRGMLSLVNLGDVWLRFDLREDLARNLKVGDEFTVKVPALGDRRRAGARQDDRAERRICGMAVDSRDRRLRSAHLRGSGLPDRARCRACAPA